MTAKTFKASFSQEKRENGRWKDGDKHRVIFCVVRTKTAHQTPVRVTMWRSRTGQTTWANIRIFNRKRGFPYRSGFGKSGNFGTTGESDALENAMKSAGVTLNHHLDDEYDQDEALKAILRALGYTGLISILRG